MSEAPMQTWLAAPLGAEVAEALARLRRAADVQRVAVMPDVHLATDVCVGVALATSHLLYPQAVGGDIGCGMLAVALDADAGALGSPQAAAAVLAGLGRAVPARRRKRGLIVAPDAELGSLALSDAGLEALRRGDGALEYATLGSGNHFLEIQADEDERLWLMVHSGSRAMGPAIRDHHLARAEPVGQGLRALAAETVAGAAYLHDAEWARRYAAGSRRAIAEAAGAVLAEVVGARLDWTTAVTTDHNHVALEEHDGRRLWVHRKGAMAACAGVLGVLPESMGTESFHVEGRGLAAALGSSAHGAGRALSRTEGRRQVSAAALRRQMAGVWWDFRMAERLRDEAPAVYKDVRAVLRAQRALVKVVRRLRPVLSFKGG